MPKQVEQTYVKLTEQYRTLYSIDVGKWRRAHQASISDIMPSMVQLMDVYEDATLDTHLSAKLQSRSLNVLNTPFRFVRNGEIDQDLTNDMKKRWLYDVIGHIHDAIYYGYTPLEWHFDKVGKVKDVNLMDRRHFLPNKNLIVPNVHLMDGVDITQPPYCYVYSLVKYKGLGLLLECAKYTIFKKHATAHWQQLQQLFGIPMRIAKAQTNNKQVLDKVFTTLKNIGTAGFGILPSGFDIEFIEAAKSDPYKIFQEAINVCNQELSMRVLGTPESTDSRGSFAREKVNYDRHHDVAFADLRFVEFVINDEILPLLNMWGYDLDGIRFEFDPSASLKLADSQLEIDLALMHHFSISPEYFKETYGVPVEEKVEAVPPTPAPIEKKKTEPSTPTVLDNVINDIPFNVLEVALTGIVPDVPVGVDLSLLSIPAYVEEYIQLIYNQNYDFALLSVDGALRTGDELWQGIVEGLELDQVSNEDRVANWAMMQQRNIYAFSAAKSYAELKTMRDFVFRDGKTRPFTQFREDALNIYAIYNDHWLRAEYNAVVRGRVLGKAWLDIERDKDLYPFLKYRTQGDSRVRAEHAKLDGLVLPVDSPLWSKIYPPNGWNCRCKKPLQLREDQLTESQRLTAMSDGEARRIESLFDREISDTYWHRNTGMQAILEADNTNYVKAAPAVPFEEMDAVRHYRMKEMSDLIGDDRPILQSDDVTAKAWFDAMMETHDNDGDVFWLKAKHVPVRITVDDVLFYDLKRRPFVNGFVTVEFENILLDPNEIWLGQNGGIETMTFVKYYQNIATSITVIKDLQQWTAYSVATNTGVLRQGILIYRK